MKKQKKDKKEKCWNDHNSLLFQNSAVDIVGAVCYAKKRNLKTDGLCPVGYAKQT